MILMYPYFIALVIYLLLKNSLIIHEQNTKEITTVAVVLYLIKHMGIWTKLLL